MLKYYDIISRMSDSDKIRMLCDIKCLSDKKYRVLGIPELNIREIADFCGDQYPVPEALAHTWDPALTGRVADALFQKAIEGKAGLVRAPAPRIKINPYRQALSEDPVLALSMAEAYADAAQRAGVGIAVPGFGLYKDELEWLDHSPDTRMIRELIVKPYKDFTKSKKCAAVITRTNLESETYGQVNASIAQMVSSELTVQDGAHVCTRVSAENTVLHLANGGLCFEGSAVAVESALEKYKKLEQEIVNGRVTTEQLGEEVAAGKAISPEKLNEATDRLLSFIFSVKRKPSILGVTEDATLALKAATESTVLLKNRSVLPLKKGTKIGLIGDAAMREDAQQESLASRLDVQLRKAGMQVVGFERGYDFQSERSEGLLEHALSLAEKCDIVLLFLGLSEQKRKHAHKTKRMAISANQQELLDHLSAYREKVIAVLPSEYMTDICMPEHCAAILMAPFMPACSAQALSNVLTGKSCPGGRLANTLYTNTERAYVKYKTYRERDRMKAGGFIGYRYYDLAQDVPLFPFGYGLGYAKVNYSALSVTNGKVRVELKNTGKVPTVEVAQVYVGKTDSAVIRPYKELCGFLRTELRAGERRVIEIPFKAPSVYDEESGEYVQEAGEYTVYVGSNVLDAELQCTLKIVGKVLLPDQKILCNYVHTRTNIFTDNYKLEAKIKTMKKSVFNFVAGAVALALAVAMFLFCTAKDLHYAFFDWFAIVLAITGVAFYIVEAVRRNKLGSSEQQTLDRENEQAFNQADQIPVYDADRMFVEEFDTTEKSVTEDVGDKIEGVDEEYLQYIDKMQDFKNAAADLETYAAQRGVKLRADVSKKIFSALASSRLLVTYGYSDQELTSLMKVLSGYFETELFIDRVNDSYKSGDAVLFDTDAQGNRYKTHFLSALEAARSTRHKLHIAALTNVRCENLPAYFTQFINYVKNPLANNNVVILDDRSVEVSYFVPQNVWMILNLAKNEQADKLPSYVSDVATVNRFEYDTCALSNQFSDVRPFSYYQMDYLLQRATSHLSMDENLWKKLDSLEETVALYVPFHIGNKMFLCMENYAYVYLACAGESEAAFDEALAAKLMVSIMTAMNGQLGADDRGLGEMVESILGEDRAEACKKIVNACTERKA